MTDKKSKLLPVIAFFKLCKACLLFFLAYMLRHLRLGETEQILTHWIKAIRVDPDNEHVHLLISKVLGVSPASLHRLGIGTFCYASLFATEGFGLLARKTWAEYLTVVSTVGFLPLEVYELIYKPGHIGIKAAVLVANIAILIYLVTNLVKDHRRRKAEDGGSPGVQAAVVAD